MIFLEDAGYMQDRYQPLLNREQPRRPCVIRIPCDREHERSEVCTRDWRLKKPVAFERWTINISSTLVKVFAEQSEF